MNFEVDINQLEEMKKSKFLRKLAGVSIVKEIHVTITKPVDLCAR